MKSTPQVTISSETCLKMREVFEQNQSPESAILLRVAAAREKRRLARFEGRVRRRYAWFGALATVCLCGTAFGVALQGGYVRLTPTAPSPVQEQPPNTPSPEPTRAHAPSRALSAETPSPEDAAEAEAKWLTQEPEHPGARTSDNGFASSTAKTSSPSVSDTEGEPAPNWLDVAGAMRAGDDSLARKAVAPLTESSDPETRDSAALVQLRLELGGHRAGQLNATPAQRTRLIQLASNGASPSIRASARRLLDRLEQTETARTP